ncbi:poly(A) RNA polymerase, mitochondrial [Brachionichthys hirsutus]|uniref:poly(A) RNA polymerase, mitochondrial n=1 Tax=Brachionichthys hirsutus TaxID=412623 RepID=UPI0036048EC1
MRIASSFQRAMASSIAGCKLHMRGKGSLATCLQKIESYLHRRVGTGVVFAQARALQNDETDKATLRKSLFAVQVERQEQAKRSVLFNLKSRINEKTFLKHLLQHGNVNKYFFYESYGIYAVVEFADRKSVASLLEEAAVPDMSTKPIMPFKSRLLLLKNLSAANVSMRLSNQQLQPQTSVHIKELVQRLSGLENIDQQMTSLTEAYELTEASIRLRFLTCSLVQDVAAAFFPECTIQPFGSTVNGFGKLGCDLDMILDLDNISGREKNMLKPGLFLEYNMKSATSERTVTQQILSVITECVDQFMPGCIGVQKILNARCPLLRFSHQPSGFQCDLTVSNRVAIKSTELLYLYSGLDPRVRLLVFTVRCWARTHGITSSIPGAWITNFALTLMVLFFLQRRKPAIIPTLDHLKDLAGPSDHSVIDGNDCTFVTDFSKIQLQSNTETIEHLLRDFFDFYSSFAFCKMSVNIRKGAEQNKHDSSPLYIQNPFETKLNVSKNVNVAQMDRFVALCQESSQMIQQNGFNTPKGGRHGGQEPQPWGVAALLLPSKVVGVTSRKKRRREVTNERIKSLLESLKPKEDEPQSTTNSDASPSPSDTIK